MPVIEMSADEALALAAGNLKDKDKEIERLNDLVKKLHDDNSRLCSRLSISMQVATTLRDMMERFMKDMKFVEENFVAAFRE